MIGSGGAFSRANTYLHQGPSLLLGRKGTIDKPLLLREPFWTVDTMFYTEIERSTDTQFLYYSAQTIEFKSLSTNTALPSMAQEDLANVFVATPELPEQEQIASFLDHETARIDALVAEQKRLIELLKEKRQAVISHAVTEGLDPNVPMKKSGVAWLGQLPAHWTITRVKNVSGSITSGPRGWSESVGEHGDAAFIQSGDLSDDGDVLANQAQAIEVQHSAESERAKLQAGDVLVCITGAKTGRVALLRESKRPAYLNQHLCRLRPNQAKVNSEYLYSALASSAGRTHFDISQYGLKQGLGLEEVSNTPIALPPVHEQTRICDHVLVNTKAFNELITSSELQAQLLQERRSALISAAVTGKIDVRDWQPPKPTETTPRTTVEQA